MTWFASGPASVALDLGVTDWAASLDALPVATLGVDRAGRIVAVNPAAAQLLGCAREALLGEMTRGAVALVSDAGTSLLDRELSIGEGDRVVLDAIVHETGASIAEEPWLWIVVGLAVVGAGVGIGVGVVLSQPPTDPALGYAGTTGVTVQALRF